MEKFEPLSKDIEESGQNILEQIENYLLHWKWFVASAILFLSLAFIYLRYSVPVFSASSTIMLKDERKGGIQSELSAFNDLGVASGIKNSIENEIEVLKSRTLTEKTIQSLNLNIIYTTQGFVKSLERYNDCPIKCDFIARSANFYSTERNYIFNSLGTDKFEILEPTKNLIGKYSYGEIINLDNNKLVVIKNNKIFKQSKNEYSIYLKINKLLNVAQSFKSRLNIATLGKNTSLCELTITDPIKARAEDFLNNLIIIYNKEAVDDKNFISRKTVDFIDNRIKLITNELGDVELGEEGFKKEYNVTDIAVEGTIFLQSSVELENELIENGTQLRIIGSMTDFLNSSSKGELLPINIIPNEASTSSQIIEYNNLLLDRNRIIKEGTLKSPVLINFDQKIINLKESIKESLLRNKISLNIKKNELEKQLNLIDSKINAIPKQSRLLRGIERQQQIKEALYLYLLQKREETAITLAVTAPNSKIIDAAFSSSVPVFPKPIMIYLIALAFGLSIPFLFIYISQLLDTKIKSRVDIERKTTIPYIGDIPRSKTDKQLIDNNNRSSSAEAIRIVRTNLEFLLGNVPENLAKTIFVTSTIPKEGKTFIAVNLASTIALSGKKTILIGLDIRNPQISKYIETPIIGVSNYLAKTNENIDDYLFKVPYFENFYVLPAGTIAPNPAELLMNEKVNLMFEKLKNDFDYIVVDTAPVSLVTDTLLISKNADAFIYVARANYLEKRLLKIPEAFYREKKLPNMSILLNDTVWKKRYGYGYTYGYSYGYGNQNEKKSFLSKILDKFFKS
jgi:tyrosine-protein kinase Etk/Wzc